MACRRRVALFWRLGFVASLPSDVVGEHMGKRNGQAAALRCSI